MSPERRWEPKRAGIDPGADPALSGGRWITGPETPADRAAATARAEEKAANVAAYTRAMDAAESKGEVLSQIVATPKAYRELPWHEALRAKWKALAAAQAFGSATHDVLRARGDYDGRGRCRTVEEFDRRPAWLARDAGTYTARNGEYGDEADYSMDVWISESNTIWMPYRPTQENGGGLDARVMPGAALEVAVPRGAPLRTELIRAKGSLRGRRELMEGVLVFSDLVGGVPFSPSCGYVDAISAVLS
jgi:hypothetical protein